MDTFHTALYFAGYALLLAGVIFPISLFLRGRVDKSGMGAIAAVMVIVGVFLIYGPVITEIDLWGAKVKKVLDDAESDAAEIAAIKQDLERQVSDLDKEINNILHDVPILMRLAILRSRLKQIGVIINRTRDSEAEIGKGKFEKEYNELQSRLNRNWPLERVID